MQWWTFAAAGAAVLGYGIFALATGRHPLGNAQPGQSPPHGTAIGGLLIALGISALSWSLIVGLAPDGRLVLGRPGTVVGIGSLALMSAGYSWHSVKKQRPTIHT